MDFEDLFSLARNGHAFRPSSEDIGLPHYRRRLDRHEREFVECVYEQLAAFASIF